MNVHDIQFREDMPYCFRQEVRGDFVFIALKAPLKEGPQILARVAQYGDGYVLTQEGAWFSRGVA